MEPDAKKAKRSGPARKRGAAVTDEAKAQASMRRHHRRVRRELHFQENDFFTEFSNHDNQMQDRN
jgi:hypothetical protein